MKKCTKCGIEKELDDLYLYDDTIIKEWRCNICVKKELEKYKPQKEYYKRNKADISKKSSIRYQKNKKNKKKPTEEERKKKNTYMYSYIKKRMETDANFRLLHNLRKRLSRAIDGSTKSAKTIELLGCTVPFLKKHLEAKFLKGMDWDNYSLYGWHIDHIIPCASFDMESPEQQKICFNYRNLQPLWAKDNLSKSAKLPDDPQTSLPI